MYARVVLTTIITATLFMGCSKKNDGPPSGSGLIETDEVIVSAETSGRITKLFVDEGNSVKTGDTLAIIDPSRLELDLQSMEATRNVTQTQLDASHIAVKKAERTLKYAQSERDRVAKLLKSGSATQRQFDVIDNEYDQADIGLRTAQTNVRTVGAQLAKVESDIARLRRQLNDCYPLSPQNGVVLDRLVESGEVVAPGKGMIKLARLDTVWVKVYLPAPQLAKIKLGELASVSTEEGGTSFEGRVIWTSDKAEFTPKNVQTEDSRADLVYAVKVQIPNANGTLKVGMPVFVTVNVK